MAEATGAKQEEKSTKSRVKPVRERAGQKQHVSTRHGATTNELAEDQAKDGTIGQQRAAVRPVSGDVVARAPVSTESRFAHDFSRVPTHTIAPHTVAPQTGPVVQAKLASSDPLTVNAPDDQYEQEADQVTKQVASHINVQRDITDTLAEGLYRWDPLDLRTYTVESVLRERDPTKVQRLERGQIDAASPDQCWRLIHLALRQGWVGPRDERAIEMIWRSLDNRGQLLQVVNQHSGLWRGSLEAGAELDELPTVRRLAQSFEREVKTLAWYYLRRNRDYVVEQIESLGIPDPSRQTRIRAGPGLLTAPLNYPRAATITPEQGSQLQRIQELATQVARAQEVERLLRRVQVGYYVQRPSEHDPFPTPIPDTFSPRGRPDRPPRGDEDPPMARWEEVKEVHDQITAFISGIANRCPAIYALIRDDRVEELTQAGNQGEARRIVAETMGSLLQNIDETQRALDQGRLDYRDLRPIHTQMYRGGGPQPVGAGETDWTQPLPRWVGRQAVEDYESTEFWTDMALGGVAAVAFIIAELATFGGATFFIAAGVGLGASALQAGRSWEDYYTLAQAAESNVRDELALVSQEQVSAALLSAVLDTAFAFLDIYGLGRAARLGMRAARAAPVVTEALARGAERAVIPTTIDLSQAGAGNLVEQAVRELGVAEALRRTGRRNVDDLLQVLPEESAARAQIRAYQEVGEPGNLDRLLRELTPGSAQADDIIVRAIGEFGPKRTIEMAGGWKQLASTLGTGSSRAGQQLEAWRVGLYNDLRAYIRGLPGGNEALRTGTERFASDLDISILGPNASEYRERALSYLAGRTGSSPGDLHRLLDCDIFTDPRRMHLYDYLEPLARERVARVAAEFEEPLLWNSRLYHARRSGDEYMVRQIRRQMRELGVEETRYVPLTPQNRLRLNQELDTLDQQLRAAHAAGNRETQERLIRRIGRIQAQINAAEGGGYFTGGGVRRWVSERLSETGEMLIEPLSSQPRLLLRTEQLGSVLDNLWHLDHTEHVLLEALARGLREGTSSAADVAKGLKDLGKYGGRLRQVVGEALGQDIPGRARFVEIADTFSDFFARSRAGTLQGAAASEQAQVLLGRASRAMNQLEQASFNILRELRSQAGMAGGRSNMRGIQALTHLNGYLLRAQDAVRANMQTLIRQALQTTTRLTGTATTRIEEGHAPTETE